ncbi:MAG: protease modulator HflC [Gammaproteobacteria bacterium WSBS_2016_MAG_OTU1]
MKTFSATPRHVGIAVAAIFVLFLIIAKSLFIVYPWQVALVLQFGEIVSSKTEPGLYAKLPWQNLRLFDSRVLTIDTAEPDRYITAEKENLLVDSYVKWRIVDPAKFYERLLGSENSAVGRLQEIVNRGLRDEIGKRTVKDVVTGEREAVRRVMLERANEGAEDYGVEVLDVRLKRVDLPAGVSEEVYKNMIEERRRIANERRSGGEAEKEKIRAEADRDRVIIIADAARRAEETRGHGDGEAATIYSGAYSQYPEFYDFYRTLAAYRKTLGNSGDFFLLSPKSDFFRYLKDEDGASISE